MLFHSVVLTPRVARYASRAAQITACPHVISNALVRPERTVEHLQFWAKMRCFPREYANDG